MAAAILGNQTLMEYVPLQIGGDRFLGIQDGRADVVIRVVSHSMERNVLEPTTMESFTFSRPYSLHRIHHWRTALLRQLYRKRHESLGSMCRFTSLCPTSGNRLQELVGTVATTKSSHLGKWCSRTHRPFEQWDLQYCGDGTAFDARSIR